MRDIALTVHVAAGVAALVFGPFAIVLTLRRRGLNWASETYHWTIALACLSSLVLVPYDWGALWFFWPLAIATYAAYAFAWMRAQRLIEADPIRDFVAAVSVGIVDGKPALDLDYAEDSACGTDMNVVMTGAGHFVEVQGTAEGHPFSREELSKLLDLASKGISELVAKQRASLAA